MRCALSDPLLSGLSEFLAAQTGLHFPRERWGDLERGIAAAAREFGVRDVEAWVQRLLAAPLTRAQTEVLASHLTVGETYFFREKKSFEALEQYILPELFHTRRDSERRLRIWSAGCCTGEEPYSIAMLLDRLLPDPAEWNVALLATDINPQFLRRATDAVYGDWSFRDTPGWIRERYFTRRKDGRFELLPHIRRRVTFSYLNLVDDVYPSLANNTNAMDVIFCRNVLMYFTAARAEQVVRNLHRALVDGGWLIVSPTETSHVLFSAFASVEFPGVVLYQKVAGAVRRAQPAAYQSPAYAPAAVWSPPAPVVVPTVALDAPPRAVVALPPELHEVPAPAPDQHDALSLAARTCANAGRLAEAAAWCEKAIAADKLNPAYHYLLATIHQELGHENGAAQALKRALYLDPDFVLAHFALGNLHLAQGRRREAERYFGNALGLLRAHAQGEVLPESEGLTAGRLAEVIESVLLSLPRAAAAGG